MIVTLLRDQHEPVCTLGVLMLGDWHCQTLERPWIPDSAGNPGGHPETSCVPCGTYRLLRHDTPHHPRTWCLVNHELGVYAGPTHGMRDSILIHTGNVATDVLGCILVGLGRRWTGEEWMITSSREAFRQLAEILPWTDENSLEIRNV